MLSVFSLLFACGAPDAPQDFDALNSYLYEHFESHDRYLEEGLKNLIAWLPDNEEALEEGYRVSNLSEEAITLTGQDPPDELIGIALSMNYDHSVDDVAQTSFGIDPEIINPDGTYNDREYLTDVDCFLEHECDVIQYSAEAQSFLPLNIEVISYFFSEARWVETELGMAYIQRRWQTEKPEISVDWAHVNSEYGMIITLPQEDNSSVKRIEALWIDMTIDGLPIPEDLAVQLSLGALENSIANIDNYLDENP